MICWRVRGLEVAATRERLAYPSWLESFDVDAHDGAGEVVWTAEPARALLWETSADAMDAVRSRSRVRPVREDGAANRPLLVYLVTIEQVETRRRPQPGLPWRPWP